jgi:hypothetical protein
MLVAQSFVCSPYNVRDRANRLKKGLQHKFTGQFALGAKSLQSSKAAALLPPLESSPAFDQSPRQPTQDEVRDLCLYAGYAPIDDVAAAFAMLAAHRSLAAAAAAAAVAAAVAACAAGGSLSPQQNSVMHFVLSVS